VPLHSSCVASGTEHAGTTVYGGFIAVSSGCREGSGQAPADFLANQLVVLIALLTVESAAVLLTVELIAAGKLGRPGSGRD
jgi:hypothetical protein